MLDMLNCAEQYKCWNTHTHTHTHIHTHTYIQIHTHIHTHTNKQTNNKNKTKHKEKTYVLNVRTRYNQVKHTPKSVKQDRDKRTQHYSNSDQVSLFQMRTERSKEQVAMRGLRIHTSRPKICPLWKAWARTSNVPWSPCKKKMMI